jgi:branched-subunit amino acid ABC-type transport system permease component
VPLISAIGASIFLQNAAQLLFSPQLRDVANPQILARGAGWKILINGSSVTIPYTGVFHLPFISFAPHRPVYRRPENQIRPCHARGRFG